jgi:hypothetical protein
MEVIKDEMIMEHLISGDTDAIIIGMMPLAKRIGRKSNDEYAEALCCLVERVMDLHNLKHKEYTKYLAKCMRGRVQSWRANLSVVRIPQTLYRFMKQVGREGELVHNYIHDYVDSPELITTAYHNDVFDLVEAQFTGTKTKIFRMKMVGFTDQEMADELGVSRQYVQLKKTELLEEIRIILKRMGII